MSRTERIDTGSLALHTQYVWSPVYVDAMVMRDSDFTGNASFTANERTYVMQDANFNVTGLVNLTSITGDATYDGAVNTNDFGILSQHYGHKVTGGAAAGDFNNDGVVNDADFAIVLSNFGHTGGTVAWNVVERFVYDSYGKSTTTNASWTPAYEYLGWNYLHQGGRYDAATGLYNFRNREYSPTMMRWMQQDPMGYVDGANRYEALVDGPINGVDPTGRSVFIFQLTGELTMGAGVGSGIYLASDDCGNRAIFRQSSVRIGWSTGIGIGLGITAGTVEELIAPMTTATGGTDLSGSLGPVSGSLSVDDNGTPGGSIGLIVGGDGLSTGRALPPNVLWKDVGHTCPKCPRPGLLSTTQEWIDYSVESQKIRQMEASDLNPDNDADWKLYDKTVNMDESDPGTWGVQQ